MIFIQRPTTQKNIPSSWIPAIDGLRAFAVTAVILNHTQYVYGLALGNLGVALFYAISGFLVYYVLHRDEQVLGGVNYMYFLIRRILRIWPAYFIVIIIAYITCNHDARANAIFTPLLTFTLNWDMASFTGWPLSTLTPLWSISLEQQFYIVAPLIYRLLHSRYKVVLCCTIFALSNLSRILYVMLNSAQSGNGGLYYASFSYADTFLTGMLVANWFLYDGQIGRVTQWLAFLSSVILLSMITYLWGPLIFPPYKIYAVVPYMLLPIALALLLISVMPMKQLTAFSALLSIKPLVMLAKISFSLYLVHLLVASYYAHFGLDYYFMLLIAATCLYIGVERPFLKLKSTAAIYNLFQRNIRHSREFF
ncbi:MAG: acyltransferase [Methylococcales bacterium]|nr:acyltransferase [Methylococcales bacterium]